MAIEQFPHCDSSILHAPGECTYCDTHPDWQELRKAWGINFTGGDDPEKLPCPSEIRRSLEVINRWPGNRAKSTSSMLTRVLAEDSFEPDQED